MASFGLAPSSDLQSPPKAPSRPPRPRSGYLPGLDGLRAIAILGVLMTHDLPWTLATHTNAEWKDFGGWGVQLFFAISGVLICWRLCEDDRKLGEVRLRDFYIRRFFRIQPAAWCYLLAIVLLGALAVIPFSWKFWSSALFTYTNFLVTERTPAGAAAFVGHFWTLAVEEHFYLLLSVLFVFSPRRYRVGLFALLILLVLAVQHRAQNLGLFDPVISARRTYWQIQLLLIPAWSALLLQSEPRARAFFVRYNRPWVAVLAVAGWIAANLIYLRVRHFSSHLLPPSVPELLILNRTQFFYGFDLLVLAVMLHADAWSTRLLELAPLRFLGRISYSLYLWHIVFFVPDLLPGQIHVPWLLFLAERPWKYLAALAAAVLSYYLIERPLVRLGHRLAPPATAGHRDLGSSAIA